MPMRKWNTIFCTKITLKFEFGEKKRVQHLTETEIYLKLREKKWKQWYGSMQNKGPGFYSQNRKEAFQVVQREILTEDH